MRVPPFDMCDGCVGVTQVCEPTPLPKSGTQAVRFKAVTTQHVVLRGWFQTLPIAVYGQKLAPDSTQQASQARSFQPRIRLHVVDTLRITSCSAGTSAKTGAQAVPESEQHSPAASHPVWTPQVGIDEYRAVIASALELRPPSAAEALHQRASFAVPPARLPLKQLPHDAAAALRAVLPAWRAALSAGELCLEEQMPTPEALKVQVNMQ